MKSAHLPESAKSKARISEKYPMIHIQMNQTAPCRVSALNIATSVL
jgi:hypothetical protein